MTANKKEQADSQQILATVAMSKGKHYWEIQVDKFVEPDDIMIGVVKKGFDFKNRIIESGKAYMYTCCSGKKIYPESPGSIKPKIKEYGTGSGIAKVGDTVGVLLEFNRNSVGTLTFINNGTSLGECFKDIPPGEYCPVASLYYGEV